jgi:predicted nucleotidyltransferase
MYSQYSALKAARDFVADIKHGGIRVSKAFLFGSHACGTANNESDIDVAVVSPDFSGFRFDDLGRIAVFKLKACSDIEVHPFSENDFAPDNPFAELVVQTGIAITF